MKTMKKILGFLLAVSTAVSAAGIMPVSAAVQTDYIQTFSDAESINDLTLVGADVLDGKPDMSYNAEKGSAEFEAWGSRAGFILPEAVNYKNFIFEADVVFDKTDNHNGTDAVTFGSIFGYQDSKNMTIMAYRPETGVVYMQNAIDGTVYSRDGRKNATAVNLAAENESVHLKLVVNEGLMEFFANDELCYTYYSPDDSKLALDATNQRANNFTKGGRLGIFAQANKTKIYVDNIQVKAVTAKDVAFYSNAFNDPSMEFKFASMNTLSGYFPQDSFSKGNWGSSTYSGSGWANVGQYIPVPVSGDYMIDVSFSFAKPLNSSRWMGISFGINKDEDGNVTYNTAGIHANGKMFLTQSETTATVEEDETVTYKENNVAGAKAAYGDCRATIEQSKINATFDADETDVASANAYFFKYTEDGAEVTTPQDYEDRIHRARVTVVDGVASFTFGGTTISCAIDANSTDGYVGLRSAGTTANILGYRVAPYSVEAPIPLDSYTQEFATAASISDLTLVGADALDGKPGLSYNAEKGCAEFQAWGSRAGFVLPENANGQNYVMEADITYDKTDEHNGTDAVAYGLVFGYQDSKNLSYIAVRPELIKSVIMGTAIDGAVTSREVGTGNGISKIIGENETAHLKLVVNNGFMEFFVDDELCYTYYSPDETRTDAAVASNQRANNFAKRGRVGIFAQANKTKIYVDNISIRKVDAKDVAFYSNAFNDPNMEFKFASMNALSGNFPADSFQQGNWGSSTYNGSGWSNVGQYIPVPVTGDYAIDVTFAYKTPLNSSRWMGISFGINKDENGNVTYNTAGVHANGGMFLTQKATTSTVAEDGTVTYKDDNVAGAKAAYGDCKASIEQGKINASYDADDIDVESANSYFFKYHGDGATLSTAQDYVDRVYRARVTVVDGVASFTFGGRTITCEIDKNSTDGYVGLRSAGTGAYVLSYRVAPYEIPEEELVTTMTYDYVEVGEETTYVDILIDDQKGLVDENSKVIVAAYLGERLIGAAVETALTDDVTMLEIAHEAVSDASAITLKAFLWNMSTFIPVIGSVKAE